MLFVTLCSVIERECVSIWNIGINEGSAVRGNGINMIKLEYLYELVYYILFQDDKSFIVPLFAVW